MPVSALHDADRTNCRHEEERNKEGEVVWSNEEATTGGLC